MTIHCCVFLLPVKIQMMDELDMICAKYWDVLPITVIVSLIMIVIINDGSNGNNHMT